MSKPQLYITRGQPVAPVKLALAGKFRKAPTSDEAALWQALRGDALAGLHFRRQQVIKGFIVDFYCATAQLAVELDGVVHEEHRQEDADRDLALEEIGIRTLRIDSVRVAFHLEGVLREIAMACGPHP